MQWVLWIAPGAAVAVAVYVAYVAVTKGIPAAWAMVSGWWNKGKQDIATLKADVKALKEKVGIQ